MPPPPFSVQPLALDYPLGSLLLPLTVEHVIDERSPLYGHTLQVSII